jgi:hypothetical protein
MRNYISASLLKQAVTRSPMPMQLSCQTHMALSKKQCGFAPIPHKTAGSVAKLLPFFSKFVRCDTRIGVF